MTGRRQFMQNLISGGLATWLYPGTLDAESCVSDWPPVSVFDSASVIQWIRRPIREDAPETLQAFLRTDESSGVAVLVVFPPGWKTKQLVYYNSDEAIFVLDGDFGIGQHTLRAGQYCYLPTGMIRRDICSRGGALVIAFFSHVSRHQKADASLAREVNKGLVVLDPTTREWAPVKLPRGVEPCSLVFAKPVHDWAGTRLYLVFFAPGFILPALQSCNTWQEWFVLSGRLFVRDKVCTGGTYGFFKPGGSVGPICTEAGALMLVRFADAARLQITASDSAQLTAERYLSTSGFLHKDWAQAFKLVR